VNSANHLVIPLHQAFQSDLSIFRSCRRRPGQMGINVMQEKEKRLVRVVVQPECRAPVDHLARNSVGRGVPYRRIDVKLKTASKPLALRTKVVERDRGKAIFEQYL